MLHNQFTALLLRYTQNEALIQQLWDEIEKAYDDEERYFHNLSHLAQLYTALASLQTSIQDWDSLLFAVFYHDIAYDVVRYVLENDNEERSAATAEHALKSIEVPAYKIMLCKQHILATKTHLITTNNDTNIFIDADLSILGQPWEVYQPYMKNIRKEYSIYPDKIYNSGRLKVLKHFIAMPRLYKTDRFYQLYETSARENMSREVEILSLL
ncbi:MAG: hypothetical protein M3Y85_06835 [Bacteroidota bacterium]|nr:hypothetical protein [Bacteroidota bacterium]